MKLLIIDEEFPFPLNTGKRIRSFHLARILANQHDVTYLAYGDELSESANFLKDNNITPVAVTPRDSRQSGPKFYLKLLLSIFSKLPYIVTSHYTKRFKVSLDNLLIKGGYDCLICEWTPYANYLSGISGVKKIIVAHNIESAIWQGYLANEKNPAKKAYIALQANRVEWFEKRCFNWADGAVAVSQKDSEVIKDFGIKHPVAVIENGVDLEYFNPKAGDSNGDNLVFTAAMDWRPNQDAAFYFANEILPLIKKQRPEIKTYFVGRNPTEKLLNLGKSDNITVTGTVEDVRPYISQASVYVVPLRVGGGSRLKILEAMAMKKAVVSTSLGAEGINVEKGVNIEIGDDPESFAAAVMGLLDDKKRRDEIALNGRKMVEQCYQWRSLGAKYNDYITSVVGSK